MKLVLIDRDGVLVEERTGYVKSIDELSIYPRALQAMALFKQRGFTCVMITNQSVVGRGIIELATLERIHHFLCDNVAAHGGKIEDVIFCTDHPDKATYRRKPKPGMLIEALEKYGADAAKTPMIGDALTDMEAAQKAGCPRYLVMTGKGAAHAQQIPTALQPVTLCRDILDAAEHIVTMF